MKQDLWRNNTIAIIIGIGSYNDLGLIRSCGEAGIKSIYLIHRESIVVPIYKSKYVIEHEFINIENLISILKSIEKKNQNHRFVVFPASDIASNIIDKNYHYFSTAFILPNAKGKLDIYMNKAIMADIAKECDLPVPECKSFNLAETPYPKFPLPCIIKPLLSISGEKADISICTDNSSLNSAIAKYQKKGFNKILIQELINGNNQEEIAISGVAMPDGNIFTQGVIHKKRIFGNGSTVFATIRNDADVKLQDNIKSFIRKCQYNGIFDIEFLRNDSGCYFIECNFRNGAYGYAVTKSGFNMPAFYANYTNVALKGKIKEFTFMEERSDILNVLNHKISLSKWIIDIIKTDTFLWWNWRDPKPMLRIPTFIKNLFKA